MEDLITKYRDYLVLAHQKGQESYDKTIMYLSGGALAISFSFLSQVVGSGPLRLPWMLLFAWFCWAFSIAAVAFSFLASIRAHRRAIDTVDSGNPYARKLGGIADRIATVLNLSGGGLFLLGLVFVFGFVASNLEGRDGRQSAQGCASTQCTRATR